MRISIELGTRLPTDLIMHEGETHPAKEKRGEKGKMENLMEIPFA